MEKIKNKKTKMTLDRLARMISRGFDEINSKMATKEEMNLRFDSVDGKFKAIDTQFNELEGKLEAYTSFWHRKFSEHEAWLQNLDKTVANIERHISKKR